MGIVFTNLGEVFGVELYPFTFENFITPFFKFTNQKGFVLVKDLILLDEAKTPENI